ncbi:hypothetical protein [Burkholderia gladioli]|uniref:hypothetical protein n=1 Tax=Burkholderia gladioli TaxID=28095 RepID=UPI001642F1DE|nr:hypothetical protein [Burkholderia gladioli]
MTRHDYGLKDDDSGRHDFDAGFLCGTKYGYLTSLRAAGVPAAMITSLELTAQWLEHGHDPKAAAAEIRACLAKLDATAAGGSDEVQRELRNDVLFGNHDALDAGANALDRLGANSEAAGVRAVAHELRLVASSVARAATAAASPASGDAERPS